MKKLIDYKEEIHKCSKCGLCQSVCPVYKVTGNDCSVSRGKFIMLNGIIKGDLKLNKNVNKYLDMCLKCNACKNFCPSGIDARKIFTTAKCEYFAQEKSASSKFRRIFNSRPMFLLMMNSAKLATTTYRFLKFDKLAKAFYPVLQKFGLGKKAILANEFISGRQKYVIARSESDEAIQEKMSFGLPRQVCALPRNDVNENHYASTHPHLYTSAIYFKGCVNEYINPRTKNAVENVLNKMGVKILDTHLPLECCGVPFLSGGNIEQFIKQAEYNLKQIPDDFDYFLTDCASCQNAFKEYEQFIEDENLLKKLKKINEKSINVVDFIVQNIDNFEFSEKTSFTFHKPCHLGNLTFLQEFLNKTKNVEYIEMEDFDKCCGFSGEFALNNPEISAQISSQKAENAINTKANFIVTSCPACILGLKQGLIENNQQAEVLNFIEFIGMCGF